MPVTVHTPSESGPVAVLTMSSGKVNALDVELLAALADALSSLGGSPLVLTGTSVFSAGVDLKRVLDGGAAYTDQLISELATTLTALFAYPGPTVAAVNGAAIAGGCILALACDRRLIVPDAPIGATELRVGVPFPAAALEIARFACGDQAEEVMLNGELHRGADAVARRLVHTVVEGDVVSAAVEIASDLASIRSETYAQTKLELRGPTLARIGAASDASVRAAWGSAETAAAIAANFDRLRQSRA